MIINCKDKSMRIKYDIKEEVRNIYLKPCLAIIQVGDIESSNRYVKNKLSDCDFVGIDSDLYKLGEDVTTSEVIELIEKLNQDYSVDGIIVQLPLPESLDKELILNSIAPDKDVDGLGKLSPFTPCTPKGVMKILEDIDLTGKNVVIIGRSELVGRPLFDLMLDQNATVTLCHSKTDKIALYNLVRCADIVVSAVGKHRVFPSDWIRNNAIVIDVGINFYEGKLVGDIDTKSVSQRANITPVPGGVGLLTRAMLLENTMEAFRQRFYK